MVVVVVAVTKKVTDRSPAFISENSTRARQGAHMCLYNLVANGCAQGTTSPVTLAGLLGRSEEDLEILRSRISDFGSWLSALHGAPAAMADALPT